MNPTKPPQNRPETPLPAISSKKRTSDIIPASKVAGIASKRQKGHWSRGPNAKKVARQISRSKKGWNPSTVTRERMSSAKKGGSLKQEHRDKISQSIKAFYAKGGKPGMLGKILSPTSRGNMSEAKKKWAATVFGRKQIFKTVQKSYRRNPTAAEKELRKILRANHISYRSQVIVRWQHVVDFLLPQHKLIVECDGKSHRRGQVLTADQKRDRFLRSIGYQVIRISNESIFKNPSLVIRKICRNFQKKS